VYCAHYDKFSDAPDFQGATDNTSGVSILLASISELARTGQGGNRAFLFTGEEETGLHGAAAFVDYARTNHIAIREIVDLNSFGRDQLALRPPAELPGFVFTLPFYGELVFDGSNLRGSRPYAPVDAGFARALQQIQPDIAVLQNFTSLSDSNVFQSNGIDTVAVSSSNMYYLQQTWNTWTDRVELVDERNLELAYELVLAYDGGR
jgi:Zn-dependent M28 family amino/carboxypeptidase